MFGFSFPLAKQISGVDLPRRGREYGRGRGTKGPKQIRLEILSLFLVKLPPSGEVDCIPVESCNIGNDSIVLYRPKGVQLISKAYSFCGG